MYDGTINLEISLTKNVRMCIPIPGIFSRERLNTYAQGDLQDFFLLSLEIGNNLRFCFPSPQKNYGIQSNNIQQLQ